MFIIVAVLLAFLLGHGQREVVVVESPHRDTDKVISGVRQLVTAGFNGEESALLFQVVADKAWKFQDDPAIQEKVISAFSRVKGRGVATGEDLESFRVAGFRAENIVEALRQTPPFTDIEVGSSKDVAAKVKKTLDEGKVDSTTFINAVLSSEGSLATIDQDRLLALLAAVDRDDVDALLAADYDPSSAKKSLVDSGRKRLLAGEVSGRELAEAARRSGDNFSNDTTLRTMVGR